mmetsp:Transcript_76766/g.159716  ORF Transcript_76766/g.159716 Transcript_76766/m.159716 type:complete len:365 (+) Transcript_76766:163-1257(+)
MLRKSLLFIIPLHCFNNLLFINLALLVDVPGAGGVAVVSSSSEVVAGRHSLIRSEDSTHRGASQAAAASSSSSSSSGGTDKEEPSEASEASSTASTSSFVGRIPAQLLLTAKESKLEALPAAVQRNVKATLARSPGLRLRWLGDSDCESYIETHYDHELAQYFKNERRGSFRGDICRACVLAREGGFYLDLDVELNVNLPSLVDEKTTFVSAFTEDNAILNAIMATTANNPVLLETLGEIRAWYNGTASHSDQSTSDGWMGPVTLLRGLRKIVQKGCQGLDFQHARTLQWSCGEQAVRLYREQRVDCFHGATKECPGRRSQSRFLGLQFGIFAPSETLGRELVAWSRFADCGEWGCAAGGWLAE